MTQLTVKAALRALMIVTLLGATAAPVRAAASDDTRFTTVTLRGRLTDPETGRPMVGAMVRFTSIEAGGQRAEGVTNAEGQFAVEGLPYSIYTMEIETAEGEFIYGINTLPVTKDKPVEVVMKISDRVRSTTTLENKPARFFAAVQEEPSKWRRFWAEFGIFLGAAIGVGAAAR